MALTPEGKVKAKIKAWLKNRRVASLSAPCADPLGYYHMYVPSGYGDPALDFTGCYRGYFFAIETKAEKHKPSARKQLIMKAIGDAQGVALWGDSDFSIIYQLEKFFDTIDREQGE